MVITTDLALEQVLLTRGGEFRRRRLGDDTAPDAVPRQADRDQTGVDLERADRRGVEIGQGWVHVVGARGNQVLAIDLDPHPVIGQTVEGGQAGDAAGTIQADARHLQEQPSGIAGTDPRRLQFPAADQAGTGESLGLLGADDNLAQLGRGLGAGGMPGASHHAGRSHDVGQGVKAMPHGVLPGSVD